MRGRIALLASIVALGSSGCGPKRKVLVLPAAPRVAAAKPLPQVQVETPPELEGPAPKVNIPWPELPARPTVAAGAGENPSPRPAPRRPPAQASVPDVPPPGVPAPTPAPRLGEILTDNRRREYEAEFTGYLTLARAALNKASGRQLNATQKETVARIHVFLQQAEKSHTGDLMQALQLARRADLLGQDLLKSLR